MSEFIDANEYFAAFDKRTEDEADRLRGLARIMTDVPNRGERLTAATQSALGAFTVIDPYKVEGQVHQERRARASENAYERESARAVEQLRVLPKKRLPARCYSHVRELRPVPSALVAWARELGIALG